MAYSQAENLPRLGDAAADELSPTMERRVGESIVGEMRRRGAIHDDIEIADYLNRFASTLVATAPASGFSFEFFLVRDGTLNAFALPGGFIGVHTGLIVAAQSESELASVLAHEIGHVTQRHIARMLARERQASVVMLAALVLAVLAARSNPQAAGGVASLGSTVAQQQMLGFSRDAEREADRVGLEILRQGGFDSNGMISFFGRLQQSGRLYENSAPEYLRTHPITSERIADIQGRVGETRYRQRPDSVEFLLARAKLRALGDTGVDGLRLARSQFERGLRERTIDEAAGWFGLATVAAAGRDATGARKALAEVRRRLPASHAFVERLAGQVELDAGDPAAALKLADAALLRHPHARALTHLRAAALLARRDFAAAVPFLEDAVALYRSDAGLWRMLSEAQGGLGQPARAHRAAAEQFVLLDATPAAIEQLRLAQRAGQLDFHTASKVDARLRELETQWRIEQEERRESRR
ncbi:MAG: M48 family peptidase [Burkholderiales bacterium]|nr:MAG: M48 family peptidase [Burkholderiales bacterium]